MQTRHGNYATQLEPKTQLEHINMGTEKLYIYEYC